SHRPRAHADDAARSSAGCAAALGACGGGGRSSVPAPHAATPAITIADQPERATRADPSCRRIDVAINDRRTKLTAVVFRSTNNLDLKADGSSRPRRAPLRLFKVMRAPPRLPNVSAFSCGRQTERSEGWRPSVCYATSQWDATNVSRTGGPLP